MRFVAVLAVVAMLMPARVEAHAVQGRCPQYEQLLARHGLPAAAFSRIMWRESRCNPRASHYNRNGTVDRGLLQINSIHLADARLSASALYNPVVNVKVAARLYRQAGMRPWRATS